MRELFGGMCWQLHVALPMFSHKGAEMWFNRSITEISSILPPPHYMSWEYKSKMLFIKHKKKLYKVYLPLYSF